MICDKRDLKNLAWHTKHAKPVRSEKVDYQLKICAVLSGSEHMAK